MASPQGMTEGGKQSARADNPSFAQQATSSQDSGSAADRLFRCAAVATDLEISNWSALWTQEHLQTRLLAPLGGKGIHFSTDKTVAYLNFENDRTAQRAEQICRAAAAAVEKNMRGNTVSESDTPLLSNPPQEQPHNCKQEQIALKSSDPGVDPVFLWEDTKKWVDQIRKTSPNTFLHDLQTDQQTLDAWYSGHPMLPHFTTELRRQIKVIMDSRLAHASSVAVAVKKSNQEVESKLFETLRVQVVTTNNGGAPKIGGDRSWALDPSAETHEFLLQVPLCKTVEMTSSSSRSELFQGYSNIQRIVLAPGSAGSLLISSAWQLIELPKDLLRLTCLRELEVACECLKCIPPWIGEILHLETLCLHGCNMFVTALPETIGYLTKLKRLTLPNFALLEKLPLSIERLTTLVSLEFMGPAIKELPMIGALTKLERLAMDCSVLLELPEWIGNLRALQTLHLILYAVKQLPLSLWELTGLRELELCVDGLECLSAEIGNFTALCKLDLGFHNMKKLPASISKLTNLQSLTIDSTTLKEVPFLGNLVNVQSLKLYNLFCISELPSELWNMTGLTSLVISAPGVETLSSSIGQLTGLETLKIIACSFVQLPESFKFLTSLQQLTLSKTRRPEGGPGNQKKCCVFKTLAVALPALRQLRDLNLEKDPWGRGNVVLRGNELPMIASSLKAWPLPFLLDIHSTDNGVHLNSCWRELAMPVDAAEWDNVTTLRYFREQQENVAAFVSGQHARLGASCRASCLNEQVLVMIIDEVLGRSKFQMWQSCGEQDLAGEDSDEGETSDEEEAEGEETSSDDEEPEDDDSEGMELENDFYSGDEDEDGGEGEEW